MTRLSTSRSRSRGATLLMALIFLVLMSLFAISAFNSSSTNMRIVGNTQTRQESAAAVQAAIEETISSTEFSSNPDGVAASPLPIDVNGDNTADYTVSFSPKPYCYRAIPTALPAAPKVGTDGYAACRSLPSANPTCVDSGDGGCGGAGSSDANPLGCEDAEWNVRAAVTDAATETTVAANQGVAVTIFGYQVTDSCK